VKNDSDSEGDGIPPREDTIGKDIPTIVPYGIEFGIDDRRMRKE
jgi:hypothetical protein